MTPQGPQYIQNTISQLSGDTPKAGWPIRFLSFSFSIFLIVFVSYLGLSFGYQPFLNRSINQAESELGALSAQISEAQKENIITLYSQMMNIRQLLRGHALASGALQALEQNTSQRVVFSDLNLNLQSRDMFVEGFASDYQELALQLALFEESPLVERATLEDSQLQGGVVRFRARLTLLREVMLPQSL